MEQLKALPADLEAERIILSGILNKNNVITELTDIITPGDFYKENHKFIYKTFLKMYGKNIPIEIASFANMITTEQLTSIGGVTYLAQLLDSSLETRNIKHYAKILKQKSDKRTIIRSCHVAIQKSYDETTEASAIVEGVENEFINMNNQEEEKTVNISELMLTTFEVIEKNYQRGGQIVGITTGYSEIDKAINGFTKGDYILIAARPSMGKTLFTLNMLRKLPKEFNGIIFELEMTKEKIGTRFLSAMTGINSIDLSRGKVKEDDFLKIGNYANMFSSKNNIYTNCKSGLSLQDIRSEAKKIKLKHGLDVIFIDHIGKIKPTNPKASKNDQISLISEGLKTLAKDLDVCVVALSQLSRACEQRADKRPMLSDLRDSGTLEQDADTVMMLYRDDYYAEREQRDSKNKNVLEVFIAKNRDGEVGCIELYCNLEKQIIKGGVAR